MVGPVLCFALPEDRRAAYLEHFSQLVLGVQRGKWGLGSYSHDGENRHALTPMDNRGDGLTIPHISEVLRTTEDCCVGILRST
jgi:hypothetical protein